jgi:nucleoside-diphosphate-sugar epimerase
VRATRAAADRPGLGGVYNVGGGSRISLRESLQTIEDLAGRPLDIRYVEMQSGDVRDTGADTTAARRDLGFAPATSVREGLEAEFAWAAGRAQQPAR